MTRRLVRAYIQMLPRSAGGRSTPIISGYRSLVRFDATGVDFGFELQLEAESVEPGESGFGCLSLWATAEIPDLSVGQGFELREGTRIVGHGSILDLCVSIPGLQDSPDNWTRR